MPPQVLVAARIADSAGSLEAGLRSAADPAASSLPLRQALAARTYYLAWMLFAGPMIITFVAIKIMPAFLKIFEDFEVELPAQTILLAKLVATPFFRVIGGLAPLIGSALFLYVLAWNFGLAPAPTFGLRRRVERGNILRALALAVESGRPLGEMLAKLSNSYPSKAVAVRLQSASADVSAGGDWTESLVKYNLIGRSDADALRAAQRVGNLAWVLRQLGDASDRRLLYRLQAALNVISPLIILALAAVVFVFVVCCFIPLVALIQSQV